MKDFSRMFGIGRAHAPGGAESKDVEAGASDSELCCGCAGPSGLTWRTLCGRFSRRAVIR